VVDFFHVGDEVFRAVRQVHVEGSVDCDAGLRVLLGVVEEGVAVEPEQLRLPDCFFEDLFDVKEAGWVSRSLQNRWLSRQAVG
jgi:hypothetical protein